PRHARRSAAARQGSSGRCPRNKSDAELKFIADHGGFVGVTMFAPFLAKGIDSTIDDYAEAIEYTMNIVGEDSIGIGTDFTQGHGQ
ncbi:membrane dipeptidase, partial [Pseudomonas sp. SIMBA_077]